MDLKGFFDTLVVFCQFISVIAIALILLTFYAEVKEKMNHNNSNNKKEHTNQPHELLCFQEVSS